MTGSRVGAPYTYICGFYGHFELWCPVLMMCVRDCVRLVSVLDWMSEVGGGYSGCDLEGLA